MKGGTSLRPTPIIRALSSANRHLRDLALTGFLLQDEINPRTYVREEVSRTVKTTYAISLRQPAYMPGFGDACLLVSACSRTRIDLGRGQFTLPPATSSQSPEVFQRPRVRAAPFIPTGANEMHTLNQAVLGHVVAAERADRARIRAVKPQRPERPPSAPCAPGRPSPGPPGAPPGT